MNSKNCSWKRNWLLLKQNQKAVNEFEEELNGEFQFLDEEVLPEENCSSDHLQRNLRSLPSAPRAYLISQLRREDHLP